MRQLRVFIAAPFQDASLVREIAKNTLGFYDIECTSRWAYSVPEGLESFENMSIDFLRNSAIQNDENVIESDLLVALARPGVGGEMFAETRFAIEWRVPVFWCGEKKILSSFRSGVARFGRFSDIPWSVIQDVIVGKSHEDYSFAIHDWIENRERQN